MKTKTTSFSLTDSVTGKVFKWTFWRESNKPALWALRDHEGYTRNGPSTWIDFVPFVHMIAENYGLSCKLS